MEKYQHFKPFKCNKYHFWGNFLSFHYKDPSYFSHQKTPNLPSLGAVKQSINAMITIKFSGAFDTPFRPQKHLSSKATHLSIVV